MFAKRYNYLDEPTEDLFFTKGEVTMKNPNGYGTVYKLSGTRRRPFIARVTAGFTEDGKQLFHTIGYFKTRKEANIALAEYNNNPYDVASRKMTFAEVYEQWSTRRFPDLSSHRVEQYKSVYRSMKEFHNLKFSNLRLNNLQAYFDRRQNEVSSGTLEHHKVLLNQLYKYALKHEIADKNYAQLVEFKKSGPVAPHSPLTQDEIDILWAHCDERDVQIILILIYTGMRVMELLTLKRENVFLSERFLIGGFKSESGTDRTIPISKKILPFIERFYALESEVLIPKLRKDLGGKDAYSYSGFRRRVWKQVCTRFGFDHSLHDTRHTTASLLNEAGVNKIVIKRILGHRDEDVTEGYVHVSLPFMLEAIDKI